MFANQLEVNKVFVTNLLASSLVFVGREYKNRRPQRWIFFVVRQRYKLVGDLYAL
jgi:hypothetical protein